MDHLPLPQDRYIGNISIPFLASDKYTSPFHDYPERNGWKLEFRQLEPDLIHTPASLASKDLGSLLQTWLYFGLLSEFLGESVDVGLFQEVGEPGAVLVSKSLEKLVCARTDFLLEHSQAHGPDVVQAWQDAFNTVLLAVRHQTLLIVGGKPDPNGALSLTCLGVTVLADYLVTALGHLCQRCGIEIPIRQRWRVVDSELSLDTGLPVVNLMHQKGWCPHDIALFNGTQVEGVSTLWYLANLSPPKADLSHSSCTAEKCSPMQLEKSQYVQAHTTAGCDCASVGPDREDLASIIWSGGIPVVTLSGEQVKVERHMPGSDFIAISHVWADGMGNPHGNSLPVCIARELQRLVNELPTKHSTGTPFWIDTFCVPRSPPELKTEALLRMREPYERAANVLVLDSYLRRSTVSGASPFELLARIAACSWSQRLWTFQEGRLPTDPARVIFAFQDGMVDLLKELKIRHSHFPTLASHTVQFDLLFGHHQTQLIGTAGIGFPEEHLHSMEVLRFSLRTRKTSRAADEALCIGGAILRLPAGDVYDIIQADGDLRMVKIWRKLSKIPTGVAFSKAPRKLKVKGYRWAPATFMGSLDLSLADWEGPNQTIMAGRAVILPSGLAIKLPAWILGVGDASCQRRLTRLCDQEAVPSGTIYPLYDQDGRWFNCVLGNQWHDAPANITPADHLVLILDGSTDFAKRIKDYWNVTNVFQGQGSLKGLLASYRDYQEGDIVPVTVHRHVTCNMVSIRDHEVRNLLKVCADEICDAHSETLVNLRGDEQGLSDLVSDFTKQYLSSRPEILEMMRASNIYHTWGDSADLALDDCIIVVKILVELGPCYTVTAADRTTWCVD